MAAIAFPDAALFGGLRVSSCTFDLSEAVQIARTGGGEILPSDMGPRLWTATVQLARGRRDKVKQQLPRLSLMRQAGATFFASDPTRTAPIADPGGTLLGAATPTIGAISGDMRQITISGLPVGYVLTESDMLSFAYGSNPVRYALHQLVIGGVADSGGDSPALDVIPPIRSGATVGTAITLLSPVCKAQMIPGSFSMGQDGPGPLSAGASFRLIQTLR